MINDHNYFDHDADIGIIGRGASLEQSFEQAAKALFALMTDIEKIAPKETVKVNFEERDIELALVTWLNLLIAKAQAKDLVFSQFTIQKKAEHWQGQAQGETWNDKIERGIDVKGATLTMLSVKKINEEWQAQCVVDV